MRLSRETFSHRESQRARAKGGGGGPVCARGRSCPTPSSARVPAAGSRKGSRSGSEQPSRWCGLGGGASPVTLRGEIKPLFWARNV